MVNGIENWEFVCVLPNLSISKSIGNEYIAISPLDDPRLKRLVQLHSNIRYLVTGFTDQLNNKMNPSVVIRDSKSHSQFILDSIIDFRNIYAMCCVICGWQDYLNREDGQIMPSTTLYSNYFDIYPIIPHSKGDYLAIVSPAVRGIDTASNFVGQISPNVVSQITNPNYDTDLYNSLMMKWIDRHKHNQHNDWELNSLFRSLQIAYQALSMPDSNFITIYDYGTNLSLWVSALETLAHSESKSVGLMNVLSLLNNSFISKTLRRKSYKIDYKGDSYRVNLIQKLYKQIYDARNSYIHGNAINMNHITAWGKSNRHHLSAFAPLIFKVALISKIEINNSDDAIYNQLLIEGALLKSKTKKPKSVWDSI